MSVPDSTSQHLEYLREAYVYNVNAALEQGREDLAVELADDYLDEVRNALEVASHPRGKAASSPKPPRLLRTRQRGRVGHKVRPRTGRWLTGCDRPDGGLDRCCSAGQGAGTPAASLSWE